jgi:hypothetical protein
VQTGRLADDAQTVRRNLVHEVMQMAVHFTGPVLFAGKDGQRKWFADLPVANNPDYVVYMDDFTGIAIDKTNDWTELKDTNATVAIGADVLGGVVVLTSEATTDNDGASIQGNEIFAVAAGRDIWFETKLFITDAEGDAMDVCVGLTVNFATNPEAMLTAADRIVFQINDGDSNILCKTEKTERRLQPIRAWTLSAGLTLRLAFTSKASARSSSLSTATWLLRIRPTFRMMKTLPLAQWSFPGRLRALSR